MDRELTCLLQASAPKVDETGVLFMLGACASFVSYLINKARAAGILHTRPFES
jgi:threonine/homoserine efflux transporter RhtA